MAEYIERKRAIVDACNALELYPSEYAKLENALNRTPAADVAPVRHGGWTSKLYKIECSVCDHQVYIGTSDLGIHREEKKNFKYCPNCGARMDLED